ncbi:NAD-dependent epimerase/dehydratase family protein [Georgenia sp. AZ-5]|uniref:NAD-dependent epimerase/dehydratase family protein n=1 Tax=Georgenia sp. AZ-5 TaxID=3367526 RepID=UPI003754DE29
MRIFLAGATGALGRRLVPQLREAGHDVVGTTTSPAKVESLSRAGVVPVLMDGLDGAAVRRAVLEARPDVVVHQFTALARMGTPRHLDKAFALTNRLRTEGLDHLLAAAREAGAGRIVAQSFTGWTNERAGGPVKDETDPLDPHPAATSRATLAAIRHLEETVTAAEGIDGLALRYGALYGPGTGIAPGGELLEALRARRFPLIGGGTGIFSFVHVDDAAAATVLALDRGGPGVYNIVDDEPAPVREWLPYAADVIGARRPVPVPAWLARPLAGEHVVSMMTVARGSSNAKARRELGWAPGHRTWREGFRVALADAAVPPSRGRSPGLPSVG